jgi:hypothetical protein
MPAPNEHFASISEHERDILRRKSASANQSRSDPAGNHHATVDHARQSQTYRDPAGV